MVHAINIVFLIGVTILRYKRYGSAAAAACLIGMTLLITAGSTLPWYAVVAMAIWLGYITGDNYTVSSTPEPKI